MLATLYLGSSILHRWRKQEVSSQILVSRVGSFLYYTVPVWDGEEYNVVFDDTFPFVISGEVKQSDDSDGTQKE